MINIKKIIFGIIKSSVYLVVFLTLVLFFYATFFFKPPSVEKPPVEKKEEENQITKSEKPLNVQSQKQTLKETKKIEPKKVEDPIQDSLFATVGNKAITRSDIVNEIKTILILSNQSYSQKDAEFLEKAAIKMVIKRNIKQTEVEKYDSLKFNQNDLDKEINQLAINANTDLNTLKNIFVANGINFSNIINQIQLELLWNSLIFNLYKSRLSININEIEEQLKLIQNKKEIQEYLVSEIIIRPIPSDKMDSEIKKIINKINTEGFEKVAISLSISNSASSGGNLGWINESVISEKLRSKIIRTPVGTISEPIILPEGILFFKIRDKRKLKKNINLADLRLQLSNAEKTKILNMYSLSHYDNLKRSIAIKYY